MAIKAIKNTENARVSRPEGFGTIAMRLRNAEENRKTRERKQSYKDFEKIDMESVVNTLKRLGYNPTEALIDSLPNLNEAMKAKINQALAEMGQRELVAEKKEIKHEGISLLDVLEAQARAQLSDEDND